MNVCFAVLHYDPTVASNDPLRYLDQVPIHRYLPSEVARLGHTVTVVHLYPSDHAIVVDGVRHEFVSAGTLARAISKLAVEILDGIERPTSRRGARSTTSAPFVPTLSTFME